MPRATNAPASRLRRKRILKRASGFYGARSKLIRTASEAVERANVLSTFHRKARKGEFRALWITRLAAACKLQQISYSRFIQGLTKAGVALNRKMLSEIAIHDEAGFTKIVNLAKSKIVKTA